MKIIKILICGIIFFIVPFLAGLLFKRHTVCGTYAYGQVLLWAVFQLVSVPYIYFRCPFTWLFYVYLLAVILISIFGLIKIKRVKKIVKPRISLLLVLAFVLIIAQIAIYFIGIHLDEDDARWIAEANDALSKNTMFLHNPANGEYLGRFTGEMRKDVFSPWPMYIAFLAKVTMLRPAIIAHSIYAPILLMISYMIYYQIGLNLFKHRTEIGSFMFFVAVINLFYAGNVYTQSVFSLTRIWQGKAVVAAVVIPLFLLLLINIEKNNHVSNWIMLFLATTASCLFSGMGVAISLILCSVYGGFAFICKRFNRIPFLIIAVLPPIAYGLLYFWLRG